MNGQTRRAASIRKRLGTAVTFRSTQYKVSAKRSSPSEGDASGLAGEALQSHLVSTDPHLFTFNAQDFAPYTVTVTPAEGELITWHGLAYVISLVTFDDVGDDTNGIAVHAFRKVG